MNTVTRAIMQLRLKSNEDGCGFVVGDLTDKVKYYELELFIQPPVDPGVEKSKFFHMVWQVPRDWPNKELKIYFRTPVVHPNVYNDYVASWGYRLCHDVISCHNPNVGLFPIIQALQQCLVTPNADSAANVDSAKLFRANPDEFFTELASHLDSYGKTEEEIFSLLAENLVKATEEEPGVEESKTSGSSISKGKKRLLEETNTIGSSSSSNKKRPVVDLCDSDTD
jgi:ubiquitin-protein ligase